MNFLAKKECGNWHVAAGLFARVWSWRLCKQKTALPSPWQGTGRAMPGERPRRGLPLQLNSPIHMSFVCVLCNKLPIFANS